MSRCQTIWCVTAVLGVSYVASAASGSEAADTHSVNPCIGPNRGPPCRAHDPRRALNIERRRPFRFFLRCWTFSGRCSMFEDPLRHALVAGVHQTGLPNVYGSVQMRDEDEGHAAVDWHGAEESLERVQTAGGCTDPDGQEPRLVHVARRGLAGGRPLRAARSFRANRWWARPQG